MEAINCLMRLSSMTPARKAAVTPHLRLALVKII